MSTTPRSRTPSAGLNRASSTRLVIPALKPNLSRSPSISIARPEQSSTLDSTASSVVGVPLGLSPAEGGGILVQDAEDTDSTGDATTEDDNITVMGQVNSHAGDDAAKRSLRDQLRRTLSSRPLSTAASDVSKQRARMKVKPMHELSTDAVAHSCYSSPREYFILTDAGKPVFTSHPTADTATTIGIISALVSVFLDDNGDKLRCINTKTSRITFLLRPPLYYICVSTWGEPESLTRSHLEYLHLQILSIVTAASLHRIFERRTNFDLKRMLNGTETFLTSMISRLQSDLSFTTSSLHVLKIDPVLRKRAADALVPSSKVKDILYVVLVARGQVVSLIRPRKHSIHPADIHILLNTIHTPSIMHSPASASWIPICLPKFNPAGFVNAYVAFLRHEDADEDVEDTDLENSIATLHGTSPTTQTTADEEEPPQTGKHAVDQPDSGIALVCIGGSGEFERVRTWCDSVSIKLESDGILADIMDAIYSGTTEYTVSELGIPGLRHFVYKSRSQVQLTMPVWEEPYGDDEHGLAARKRVMTLYQLVHDAIHGKSGQESTLKLQYLKTEEESVMGWITQPFELYITLSSRLPKSAAVGAANAVARWVKKEEGRLFLRDAPTF